MINSNKLNNILKNNSKETYIISEIGINHNGIFRYCFKS